PWSTAVWRASVTAFGAAKSVSATHIGSESAAHCSGVSRAAPACHFMELLLRRSTTYSKSWWAFSLVRFDSVAETMVIGVLLFVCVRSVVCETGGKVIQNS